VCLKETGLARARARLVFVKSHTLSPSENTPPLIHVIQETYAVLKGTSMEALSSLR